MRRLEYIQTLSYRLRRANKEAYRRAFRLHFEAPVLLSKGMKLKKRIAETDRIQNIIYQKLRSENRRSFTGDVAVTMTIYVNQKNAPQIQSIPKFYIDTLFDTRNEGLLMGKKLILKDDRQIKYLFVDYRRSNEGISKVNINIFPFRTLINQVDLVEECRLKSYDSDEWDEDDVYREDEYLYELLDHIRDKDRFISKCGEERYKFEYFQLLRNHQENYYHNLRIKNASLCRRLRKYYIPQEKYTGPSSDDINSILELTEGIIFDHHMQVDFGSMPVRKGQGDKFKALIKQGIDNFVKANRFLMPTLVPISATIIFQPPATNDKDLDNLARVILPPLFNKFGPPTSVMNALQPVEQKIFKKLYEVRDKKENEGKFPMKGFSSYCILSLPSDKANSPLGFVKLNIHDANTFRDLTSYVSHILFDCERDIDEDDFLN